MDSFKLETKEERLERQKDSVWSWKVSSEDLKNQVDNYNNLKITESYRGISVLLGIFSIILTLITVFLGLYDFSSVIFDLIIIFSATPMIIRVETIADPP